MKPILSLLTLLLAGVAGAGARTITGTILADNDSTAIVGAVCHLKSIHTATVTDPDGHFAISTSTTHPDTLAITATGCSRGSQAARDKSGGREGKSPDPRLRPRSAR